MPHPFKAIPPGQRWYVFLPLLVVTLLLVASMNVIGEPLITDAAPNGIVSFELAGTVARARQILDSWDQVARLHAAFSLGLDFLFLVAYSTTIGFGCAWAGDVLARQRWPVAGVGVPLAWGQWLAALLDAVENVALITMLLGTVAAPRPAIARWCALPKFLLVGAGLLYAAYGGLAGLPGRISRRT